MITLKKIRECVEKYFELNIKTEKGKIDSRRTSDAKKIYYKLSKLKTRNSLKEIGNEINRTHSTVLKMILKADELIETDILFRNDYENINLEVNQMIQIHS